MSQRLVVVSNRVPQPAEGASPGGLVSALLPSLESNGASMWFGWSGETSEDRFALETPRRVFARGVEYATVDLTAAEVHDYYEEYGNRVLWPLFHGLVEYMAPEATEAYATYRAVNRRFARMLFPLLRPSDLIWVHDYHLIPLGEELRRLGWQGRIGYFHHTPIPDVAAWALLPQADALASAFPEYDLIGVQTERDRDNLEEILQDEEAAQRLAAYPISIDTERFREFAASAAAASQPPLPDASVVYLGVERLDYTKGIPQRLEAFERALGEAPEMRDGACFVQWAAPSRTGIPEYQAEREAIEEAARSLEARFPGRLDLSFDAHPAEVVAPALQYADVCVVSSIVDGMNLVAKEFAAVHSEEHPGVLVLSDMCGAAEELKDALIYPANDIRAMSDALQEAYFMPLAERRRRAGALRDVVDRHTSRDWLAEFVADLGDALPRTRLLPATALGMPRRDGRERTTPAARLA